MSNEYNEINELQQFQICSNKNETPLVCTAETDSTELADVRVDCIFNGQQLQTVFLQRALKFEILLTTLYKCAVLL